MKLTRKLPRVQLSSLVLAISLGYSTWFFVSNQLPYTAWLSVPIAFYHVSDTMQIDAPDTILISLATSSRYNFRSFDTSSCSMHINAHELHEGNNNLTITREHLLLPSNIRLVDCYPANFTVTMTRINNSIEIS